MVKAKKLFRFVATVAVLLLAATSASDRVVQAKSKDHGLPGTWFVSLPGGLTGFYTYNQHGTMTGVVSTIFGALPQPPGPLTTASSDHGIWRKVGGGFEGAVFRILFDPSSGDPVSIVRIRTFFGFDPGRDSTSGTFLVDQWFCPPPDAVTLIVVCPDPNSTPPDIADISPPPPLNTFTQTRVRLP